jgi:hypothetical protein
MFRSPLPYPSRISAAWPVTGDGLRRGSGESAEFPTEVKEVLAMFGISTIVETNILTYLGC